MTQCDISLIGLTVMGQNLALNIERNGYWVTVYNRIATKTQEFIKGRAVRKNIVATYSVKNLVDSLRKPHIVMIMVQAGARVDVVIAQLKLYLDPGDLIIDGGNSCYRYTERRSKQLAREGINFLGVGISCEDWAHNLEAVLDIPGLKGINFHCSPVEMNPSIVQDKAGGRIAIWGDFGQAGVNWEDYYQDERAAYVEYYLQNILGKGRGVFISPFDNAPERRTFGLNGTCRQGRSVE